MAWSSTTVSGFSRTRNWASAVAAADGATLAVVGAPAYLADRGLPKTPHDLTAHACINLRLPTLGGLYAWEFEKDGGELRVRVDGPLIFNSGPLMLGAAVACLIFARAAARTPPSDASGGVWASGDPASGEVASGRLVRVLADWCPPFSGYHLYYPSRRQLSPARGLLIEALRYRGPKEA